MIRPTLQIQENGKTLISGATCSRVKSEADAIQFMLNGSFKVDFSCILQLQQWQTGEIDIVCVEATGSSLLHTVIGRMRLSIYQQDNPDKQWCAIKTAQLKSTSPPHANLFLANLDYYTDYLGFDIKHFLQQFGSFDLDTIKELFNETGRSKNTLALVYNKNEIEVPLAAFVASRVIPILISV